MTDFVIDELVIPETLDEPGAAEFLELVDMRNRVETETLAQGSQSAAASADLA
jgi:hypothetical protein